MTDMQANGDKSTFTDFVEEHHRDSSLRAVEQKLAAARNGVVQNEYSLNRTRSDKTVVPPLEEPKIIDNNDI